MTKAVEVKSYLETVAAGMPVVPTDQVQVTYGFPMRAPEKKWIAVGEIRWESSEWATNRSRNEAFSVQVIFDVQMSGATAKEVEAYAVLMSRDFLAALMADPSLGGLAITSGFQPRSMRAFPSDRDTYECQFETEVSVTCRV
ncbi:hypothetical protein O7635_29585 [Asanoa sp. WMMD1127]|uniref:hypothetical protein n=1 Tax=Asanoa sp. WMMD1127 TaxID=3016107 RepID=UPI002417E98D|nr:hypothetical protein [Asanoa sp. WMMD1127]MDG4826022.1 hypothetical protein [Asanoa sp. WMMD1127]